MDEDAKLNSDTDRPVLRPDSLYPADMQQLQMRLKQAEEALLISEEKKSSVIRKLKKSRREFMTIFDSVPAMIWYRDHEGKILRVNQCAADSVRKSVRELIGQNYYELFPDDAERARQQDLQVMQTGQPLTGQLRSFEVDGQTRWALVDRIPLRNQDQAITGVMVFAQDVTETKQAEDRLIQAKREIEITNEQLQAAADRANQLADRETRSNLAKSEMLATSSHDLRTPMNAILGFADLLTETKLDDEQAEYVKTINSSAKGLLTLLNDILDFAKLEAGKLNIEIVSCLLKEFVGEIRAMMETSVKQKGLEFIVQVDKRLPHAFYCDPLRLKQCLINLIGNAIKFTETGHIALYVTMEEHRGQKCIRMDVEDTGIGIAPDKLNTIFNSYSQAELSTSRHYGGTGLGLSITKRLAELLGGQISVTSQLNNGSLFTITLPLMSQASDLYEEMPPSPQRRRDELMDSLQGRILLAETEVPSQLTMNLLLRRSGLEVKTASSEKHLIRLLGQHHFDLILLDSQLDNGRGAEIVRNLRSNDVRLPIVAITTQDSGVIQNVMSAGCNECLIKPISRRKLHEVITIQLENASYDRRRRQVRDKTVAADSDVQQQAVENPVSMDVVEGQLDQDELLEMLPSLVSELQQVLGQSDLDQAVSVLEVLSKVGLSCQNTQLTEKVDQIRQSLSRHPDSVSRIGVLVDELDTLCGDIDRCCNKE